MHGPMNMYCLVGMMCRPSREELSDCHYPKCVQSKGSILSRFHEPLQIFPIFSILGSKYHFSPAATQGSPTTSACNLSSSNTTSLGMPKGKARATAATIPTVFVLFCCWPRGRGGGDNICGGAVSVGGDFRSGCRGSSWRFICGCGRGNNNIIQICLSAALPTGSVIIILVIVVVIPPAPAAAEVDGVAIIVVVSIGGHDGEGRSGVPMLMLVPETACLLRGRWCWYT